MSATPTTPVRRRTSVRRAMPFQPIPVGAASAVICKLVTLRAIGGARVGHDPPGRWRASPDRGTATVAGMARARSEEPQGLVYRPEVLTPAEEAELLAALGPLRFDPIVIHGQAARRTARHY